jgi:hypothetical protein
MKTKLNITGLTEEIKENIRVRAKQHINSTDPCPDHWDSIETPDGFVDFNIWQDDDYKNGEWIVTCYETYISIDNGYRYTDTETSERLAL